MLRPTYPLETKRLRLRPLGVDDLESLLEYHSSPDVHRFLPMGPMDANVVESRISSGPWSWTTIEDERDAIMLGVELIETGALIGDVMLAWVSRTHGCGEIGYVLNPRHAGHGYAAEASNELLRVGFEDLGLHRVIARVVDGNEASLALAERLGMRREAHLVKSWHPWWEGGWMDEIHLAILRSEWESRASPPT
jgi:RimJ/RimL family protein N-acetyltransferase